LPIRVACAVDFWPVANKTYELNHPGTEVICGDLRDKAVQDRVVSSWHGKADLIVGGIPCGWLSIRRNCGNAPGEEELADERRTLMAVLDLVARISPRWWCLEDVAALTKELPEGTPWIRLDAADYSPQRRRRVYVGRFPRPAGVGPLIGKRCDLSIGDRLRPGPYRIGRRTFGREPSRRDTFCAGKAYAVRPDEKAPTIFNTSTRRDPEYVILDPHMPGGMRQIEWQEAARLQGFPEDFLFYGSPTDVWTQIGRAVQIEMARVILEAIVAEWKEEAGP
jgi:site-specific DNA-cytosine methylase